MEIWKIAERNNKKPKLVNGIVVKEKRRVRK